MQRKQRYLWIALTSLFALIVGFGCGNPQHAMPAVAWNALANADTYEVYSIGPDMVDGDLDHYPFLGKTKILDSSTRSTINNALERTARESKGWTALCFNPRHGIRATHAGVTTDFIICFQCMQVEVYQGDKQVAAFSTNNSAEPLFDRILTQAGVKLAPKSP